MKNKFRVLTIKIIKGLLRIMGTIILGIGVCVGIALVAYIRNRLFDMWNIPY
ncbi:hypothetical protein [Clostridium perfringens]|uniref:hypothetical protein n=1 Tax=Clostridium perfringens TaxID=1502 RepID=UPI0024BCAEE1|nr:hypothetical protein [Clostridium perfringens]